MSQKGTRSVWDPRTRQIDTRGSANTLGVSNWTTRCDSRFVSRNTLRQDYFSIGSGTDF